jgi:hypothetical protein
LDSYVVIGRVLDDLGIGAAGVSLSVAAGIKSRPLEAIDAGESSPSNDGHLQSGPAGHFRFETSATRGTIQVQDSQWIAVREGTYFRGSHLESIVVVARSIELGGRIVDESGAALPNARLQIDIPTDFEARLGQNLEASASAEWTALPNERGEFAFGRVPRIPGARIAAIHDGFEPASVEAPLFSTLDLEIVLHRPSTPQSGVLRGKVIDASGAGVAAARVAGGLTSTLTDQHGVFALDLARAVTCAELVALKVGFIPARLERPAQPRGSESGWPDFVVLRLGAAALSISGRVVDSEKHARAGMKLWASDTTHFGAIGRYPFPIEGLLASEIIPPEVLLSEPESGDVDGDDESVLTHDARPASALWFWTTTDADGRFELPGLMDRKYSLQILDEKSLATFKSDPIRAGTSGVEIEMPAPKLHAKVVGFVSDDDGQALEGVEIRLHSSPYRLRSRVFGGTFEIEYLHWRDSQKTDAAGRFEFKDVPVEGVSLDFQADGIVPDQHELVAADDPTNVRILLHTRCDLRIELAPPFDRADGMAVLDEAGEPLEILVLEQVDKFNYDEFPLVDGKSRVVSVSSAARTLVLKKADAVVSTHPLHLSRGILNVIRP